MNEADKKRLEEMQIEARTVPLSEKERWLIGQLEAAEATCQSLIDQSSRWEAQALEAGVHVAELEAGIRAVEGLIADSRGVVGLHLNGDEAPWDELLAGGRFEDWLKDFSAALAPQEGKLEALFTLQHTRMVEATRVWQAATGKHDVLPDLGDLLGWLMARIEALESCLRKADAKQAEALELLRKVGYVYNNTDDPMQKLVFSLYTYLVVISQWARVALDEDALLSPAPSAEPPAEAKEESRE